MIRKGLLLLLSLLSYQAMATNWMVQAGSFHNKQNAMQLSQRLASLVKTYVNTVNISGKTYYTVVTPPLVSHAAAKQIQQQLLQQMQVQSVILTKSLPTATAHHPAPPPIKQPYNPAGNSSWVNVIPPGAAVEKDGPDDVIFHQYQKAQQAHPASAGFYVAVAGGQANSNVTLTKLNPGTPPEFFMLGQPELNEHASVVVPAVGFDFYRIWHFPWRTEFAYNHSGHFSLNRIIPENSINFGNVSQNRFFRYDYQTYMWNNYLDMRLFDQVIPFVGFGIGQSKNTGSTSHVGFQILPGKKEKTNFAWNASVGANIILFNHLRIGPMIQYIDLKDMDFGQIDGPTFFFPVRANRVEYNSHLYVINYMLQMSYYFG